MFFYIQKTIAEEKEKEIKPPYVLCSYEPDPIVEKEERERVSLLAQRDFLVRSYGMLEQVSLFIVIYSTVMVIRVLLAAGRYNE